MRQLPSVPPTWLPASLQQYLKYSQYHNGAPHCILAPKIQSKINISQLNYVHVLI